MAEENSKVLSIKQRMQYDHGINLNLYTEAVINSWSAGFRARWKNDKSIDAFTLAIVCNQSFCADSSIGGSQHKGKSFREVSRLDSLHVIVAKAFLEVHVDSVSVAASRDVHGKCEYAYGKVLDHLSTDLKHWPLVVPNEDKGLVIGVRF